MGKLGDALRAGWASARDDYAARRGRPPGTRYAAAGRGVACTHCGGARFVAREALLNSTVLTLASLDWLDRSATALTCVRCGAIRWFAAAPTAVE